MRWIGFRESTDEGYIKDNVSAGPGAPPPHNFGTIISAHPPLFRRIRHYFGAIIPAHRSNPLYSFSVYFCGYFSNGMYISAIIYI